MGRKKILFFAGVCLLGFALISPKAAIKLPEAARVKQVEWQKAQELIIGQDPLWIQGCLQLLGKARGSFHNSVQDVPQGDSFIRMTWISETGEKKTLFFYEERGFYWMESPYEGIDRISSEVFQMIESPSW